MTEHCSRQSFLFLSWTYPIIDFYAFMDINFILWIVNQYYFYVFFKFLYLCCLGALPAGSYVSGSPPSLFDFLGLKTFPYFLAPGSSYTFPATVLELAASPGNSGFDFCFFLLGDIRNQGLSGWYPYCHWGCWS